MFTGVTADTCLNIYNYTRVRQVNENGLKYRIFVWQSKYWANIFSDKQTINKTDYILNGIENW